MSLCDVVDELTEINLMNLKEARSDCFTFFSNFRRFWYQKKGHIFLITPGEFYALKMYRLEDINQNVISYGNHN